MRSCELLSDDDCEISRPLLKIFTSTNSSVAFSLHFCLTSVNILHCSIRSSHLKAFGSMLLIWLLSKNRVFRFSHFDTIPSSIVVRALSRKSKNERLSWNNSILCFYAKLSFKLFFTRKFFQNCDSFHKKHISSSTYPKSLAEVNEINY